MPIAMTEAQRESFDERGIIILEDFLDHQELEVLLQAVDEVVDKVRSDEGLDADSPVAVRNALARHDAFLDLVDHPRMLPLVVDAIGWNIQVRTSHLDYRPPIPRASPPVSLVPGRTMTVERVTPTWPGIPTLPEHTCLKHRLSMAESPSWK